MTAIRVMFIGQGQSGLPEDRFVNVFHFADPGTYTPEKAETCRDLVVAFYNGVGTAPDVQTNSLAAYLSPYVNRPAEIRSYNLDEPGTGPGTGVNRTPTILPFSLNAAGGTEGLPEEVAVVLSIQGAPPVGPRRRGRLYFGPLVSTANAAASTSGPSRPSLGLTSNLRYAAANLAKNSALASPWAIRSMVPTENYVTVYSAYVDDAFDTQRRRGPDPTDRQSWVTSP